MAQDIDFDKFPKRSNHPNLPRSSAHSRSQFVDYDLITINPNTGFVYGNWRETAADACRDKNVDSYIDRNDLLNYTFAQDCPPSRDGIWEFEIK